MRILAFWAALACVVAICAAIGADAIVYFFENEGATPWKWVKDKWLNLKTRL